LACVKYARDPIIGPKVSGAYKARSIPLTSAPGSRVLSVLRPS
jgi:hypothetical protein